MFLKLSQILCFAFFLGGALQAEPLSESDRELLAKLKAAPNQQEVQRLIDISFWITAAHTGGFNGFLKRSLGNGFASLPKETQATLLSTSRSREFSILNPNGVLAQNAHLFDTGTLLGIELGKMSSRIRRPTYAELIHPETWPTLAFLMWPIFTLGNFTASGDQNGWHLLQQWSLTPFISLAAQKIADILIREPEKRRRSQGAADFIAVADMIREKKVPITAELLEKLRGSLGENFYRLLHKGPGALDVDQLPKVANIRDALVELSVKGEFADPALKEEFQALAAAVTESVKQVEQMGKVFGSGVAKDMPDLPQGGGGLVGLAEDAARRHIQRTKPKPPAGAPPKVPTEADLVTSGPEDAPSEWEASLSVKKERLVAIRQDRATPDRTALYVRDGSIVLELPVDLFLAFEKMEANEKKTFMESLMKKPGVWLHSQDNPGYFRFIPPDDFSEIRGSLETEFSLWTRPVGKNRKMLLSVSQLQDDVFTKDEWMTAYQADCAAAYRKAGG